MHVVRAVRACGWKGCDAAAAVEDGRCDAISVAGGMVVVGE